MTDHEFQLLTKRCDNIREEVMKISEKDYFMMVISCMIDNWSNQFGYDSGEVALEICQLIHLKEKEDGMC